MATLPVPNHAHLVGQHPETTMYPRGTTLARVYFAGGRYPVAWNDFRHWGPVPSARFDHHLLNAAGKPDLQDRGVMYLGKEGITCLAEVFQLNRLVDRVWNLPYMAVFTLKDDIQLLDLTGAFATKMGASYAITVTLARAIAAECGRGHCMTHTRASVACSTDRQCKAEKSWRSSSGGRTPSRRSPTSIDRCRTTR